MSEPVAGEVVKASPLDAMVTTYADQFARVLPAHVGGDRFERWCLGLLRKSVTPGATEQQQKTAEVWRKILNTPPGQTSVMQALMDCASLGLEPGRTYHLVPYGGEVTGVTDYKGEIELIHRANRFAVVVAQLVRRDDEFAMTGANVPPRHDADWFADRGPIVGGYTFVQQAPDVYSMVVRMSEADFLHHRDKARTKTVWDEWPEAMRLKTLVHQVRKYVPWSVEVRP